MAKLIQKSSYLSPGKSSGYMKYIATREGVEKLPQQQTGQNYMGYISNRPGVEKIGSHGLFSSAPNVGLESAMDEVKNHKGRVWALIYSLKREDATRLGYDNVAAWRTLLMAHQTEIAEAMKIAPDKLRWYAAFHDAGHHPHIHLMVWSEDPRQGFLTTQGIEKMRSKLTKTIFRDELLSLYQKKDVSYKEVTAAARETLGKMVRQMEASSFEDTAIPQKMLELAQQLETVPGKKVYGYLKKPLKSLVDSIVDELAKQPEVAQCYDTWNKLRDELEGYYKDTQRTHLPLSQQKEFRAIKNIVIREAIQLSFDLQQSNETSVLDSVVANSVGRFLRQLGRIFRENSLLPTNPKGIRMDSRRRKKLQEKKMALGHKRDDYGLQMT